MKSKVTKFLSAFLVVIAVIMLYIGYKAPERAWDEHQFKVLFETPLEKAADDNYSILKLNQPIDDYVIVGAVQYCTGWILLAAACIVFSLGIESKSK